MQTRHISATKLGQKIPPILVNTIANSSSSIVTRRCDYVHAEPWGILMRHTFSLGQDSLYPVTDTVQEKNGLPKYVG